ncbi:MAG: FtsX-like permease family protein, partial [Pseudomonadota bacterium]
MRQALPAAGRQRQVVLPWGKSAVISIRSLKARFFRSLVTVLALVFAVSFLAFILVSADVADGVLKQGGPGIRQQLEKKGYDLVPGATSVGQTPKQRWIAVLSLLVCVAGIANAQLMAVTERFREIGTMKCLGAL